VNRSLSADAIVQTSSDRWLVFEDPFRIVQAETPDAVGAALEDVERLTREHACYAVGYVSFEAAGAYGLAACDPSPHPLPPVWFALFAPAGVRELAEPPVGQAYELGSMAPSIDRAAFRAAVARIKERLAAGDTYQVNFTFNLTGPFSGDPKGLFADLVAAQRGGYSAFIRTPDAAVCSASPELFFALDGLSIAARPMKGTAPRGRTTEEDLRRSGELRASEKQRAENVMIVDMVRNDLGRVAEVGTVEVPELFTLERYPNVWQMTSLVTARTRASLADIFAALHPSASVTGAPKKRTMEIIRELETRPRGVYTGAAGYIAPDGNGRFNVAIRTAVVNLDAARVEFGVGSGIVWDSDADAEYDECLLKASVLGRRPAAFELLETTKWEPAEGFALLDRHLARMRDSARYFGFAFAEPEVRGALAAAVDGATGPLRVRWRLAATGALQVERQAFVPWGDRRVVTAIAREPVDTNDPFLFHKTTSRGVYDRARAAAADADEVILWNDRREITEATTTNVIVEWEDGSFATPPVGCGLLAGTARAEAIAQRGVVERSISVSELMSARRVWLTNSVHGWREAKIVGSAG
jgi:para-aminobenzoate synthetase/4-amino-4-deoxychorismate lyase